MNVYLLCGILVILAGVPLALFFFSRRELRRAVAVETARLREGAVLREREAAARRSMFLAEASSRMAFSLDTRGSIQRLADYVSQAFADWCTVAVLDAEGRMERVASAHNDPVLVPKILELARLYVNDPLSSREAVFRTGRTLRKATLTDEDLARHLGSAEAISLARELGLRSVMVVPIRVRDRVMGSIAFGSSRDWRRFDEEDQWAAEELGRRAGIAIENAELYRKAQEAVHNRDEFLSAASHELKTPLTSLKIQLETNARLLQTLARDTLPAERILRSIRVSTQQLDRIATLVEDMLDIARIQGGRLMIRAVPSDLSTVVADACERFEPQLLEAGCVLKVDLPARLQAFCDPVRIEQVIGNLLSNAAKYARGATVEVRLTEQDGLARIEVRDTGPGIPEEFLGRIFHRYERFAPGNGKGLGLGLYISRYLVEQHGGRIDVRNHPAGGAVFTVEIPKADPSVATALAAGAELAEGV